MGKLVLIFILVSFSWQNLSQELSYAVADSLSYSFYLNNKYLKIKRLARKSQRSGIDFFYLRTRVGILAFNKERFGKALKQFEKAHDMYPTDTIVTLYLYYTYLGLNQIENADNFAGKLPDETKEKLNYSPKKLLSLTIESGVVGASASNLYSGVDLKEDAGMASGAFSGSLFYSKVYLEHRLHSKVRLHQSLGFFRTSTLNINQDLYNRYEAINHDMNYQYNLALTYQFHKKFNLAGAYAYFRQTLTSQALVPGIMGGPPQLRSFESKSNAHAGILNLSYNGSYIRPSLGFGISNLSNTVNKQVDANISIYPWSNNRLYTTLGVVFYNSYSGERMYYQKVGLRLHPCLSLEAMSSNGYHYNYLGQLGFLTYNTNDPIRSIYGGDFKFQKKSFQLTASYRFQSKIGTFERMYSPTEQIENTYKFNSQIFTLTFKWNF
jgi:tetratricopeptide (TPR) repeat protein